MTLMEVGVEEMMERAMALLEAGRLDEAEAVCEEVTRAQPSHLDAYAVLCTLYAARRKSGLRKEWILNALHVNPTLAETLLEFASTLYVEERYEECDRILEALVWADPDNHEAWNDLGVVRFAMEDLVTAERAFSRSLALDPSYGEAMVNLAALLQVTGRVEPSVALARSALNHTSEIRSECLRELGELMLAADPETAQSLLVHAT